MNICIATHCYPYFSGDISGHFVPFLAEELKSRGQRIFIFTPRMEITRSSVFEQEREFVVEYFKWLGGTKLLGSLNILNPRDALSLLSLAINGVKNLLDFIERNQIDLCLAIWAIPSGYFCYMAKKRMNIPYAVWVLGSDVNVYGKRLFLRSMLKRVLRDADHLFANSRGLIKSVEALSGKNCGFMATNRRLPNPGRVTLKKGVTNFLYVGRLERVKGVDVLIESMKNLLEDGVKANLHVLGDGSMKEELEGRVISYEIEKNVFFYGMVNAETVSSYLASCDYLVIPSRSEGMPVVFHEAMQLKVPVIVTDVGDMGQLTRRYNVGEVVEAEDIIQLKEAMKEIIRGNRADYVKKMNEIVSEFDLGKSAETFLMSIKS